MEEVSKKDKASASKDCGTCTACKRTGDCGLCDICVVRNSFISTPAVSKERFDKTTIERRCSNSEQRNTRFCQLSIGHG